MSDAVSNPCPAAVPVDAGCGRAVRALRERVPGGIVVVAPVTLPAIDAPLGWTLSQASRDRLTDAMDSQAKGCGATLPGGYVCLHELLMTLDPTRVIR